MLTEIRCDRFRQQIISFEEGLNVVLGDQNATNSIGKSTLLMIVDFGFGGGSLLDYNTDLIEELGHHDYFFVFRFDNDEYRFRRGTFEPDQIYRCDEGFRPEAVLSIHEYTAFLKHSHQVDLEDLSFRALVGLYCRVWGKQNLDVRKPLHPVPNATAAECITNLIKTFDQYDAIRATSERLAATKKRKKAMSAAVQTSIVPKVLKRDYSANNLTIANLEGELESIRAELAKYATNLSELVSKEVMDLKLEKDDLVQLRTTLMGRRRRAQRDLSNNRHIKSKHFDGLVQYFPEINQGRLASVEEFHSGLAKALRSELRAAEREATAEIARVDEAIASLDEKMRSTLETVEEPSHLVDRVYEVATTLEKARKENEFFEERQAVQAEASRLQEALASVKDGVLNDIRKRLNGGMREIVATVFGPDRKSPSITLSERNYSFEVFEDTGTGTAYAGLLVFDLTVFKETQLPVVVHDSVLFKNIENDSVSRLVEVYPKLGKQSFIAIDEIDKYGGSTAAMLTERAVIQLDDHNLLFDKDWRAPK